MTQKAVEKAFKNVHKEVEEYAEALGILESMKKATRQYAEWSAAAELRMLSTQGVKVKKLTLKTLRKTVGEECRGE